MTRVRPGLRLLGAGLIAGCVIVDCDSDSSKRSLESETASVAALSSPREDRSICRSGDRLSLPDQTQLKTGQHLSWIVIVFEAKRTVCIDGRDSGRQTGEPIPIIEGQPIQLDLGSPEDYKPSSQTIRHGSDKSAPIPVSFFKKEL